MTLENPELPDVTIEAYITEDIKTKANLIQGFETLDLDGYHMEIIIKNKSFTIQMEATKIDKMLDESLFALNTKGYQKLSMQELMEKFKAFGM